MEDIKSAIASFNLFPNYQKKRDPNRIYRRIGYFQTWLFISSFFLGVIILTFYYSIEQSLTQITLSNPDFAQYQSIATFSPICSCNVDSQSSSIGRFANVSFTMANIEYDNIEFLESVLEGSCELGNKMAQITQSNILETRISSSTLFNEQLLVKQVDSIVTASQLQLAQILSASVEMARFLILVTKPLTLGGFGTISSLASILQNGTIFPASSNWFSYPELKNETVWELFEANIPIFNFFSVPPCASNFSAQFRTTSSSKSITYGCTPWETFRIFEYSNGKTINDLLKEGCISGWNYSLSYETYYNICSPSSCYYFQPQRKSGIEVVTVLLGLIGGLASALSTIIGGIGLLIYRLPKKDVDEFANQIQLPEVTGIELNHASENKA